MKIQERYRRLLARRAPREDRIKFHLAESFEHEAGENTKYLLGAMKPVETKYTTRQKEQGNMVENQLDSRLKKTYPEIEFERQGSVSNGTHIKYYSDVDVLVIIDKFITLEPPQKPEDPYLGTPEDDLLKLRQRCLSHLKNAFNGVAFDDKGSTAIKMEGGDLACAVDVVPSNWYDTNAYARSGKKHDRGIQVLDREKKERRINLPFLFNYRLEKCDSRHSGIPRMFIRLLKTVKADATEENEPHLDISSFDLCSVVYRMPDSYYSSDRSHPLDLVADILRWMKDIIENESSIKSLLVVDDSRKIFNEGGKIQSFQRVFNDLCGIYSAAIQEQTAGKTLISEAHRG